MQKDLTDSQLQMILYLLSIDLQRITLLLVLSTMKVQKVAESQARSEEDEVQVKTQPETQLRASRFQLQVKDLLREVDLVIDQKVIRNQVQENESEVAKNLKVK